ncbi:MAG TPA: hypothetical protein PK079_18770 [Leptospiraceae bacterium]|nr:hypothetical protein [Leptospiraceae bacterium]HMW04340.1 hypothetical protein [Leptospiraceae bacterium]HMX31090.1 hypothetical protein [Leptospiraceae bacterium]HMY31906.1 hypothetical protein [Leptospiraceae bacterium]HMZ65264.1 hypothetical protein [Leptospiraceae bacterium]
MVFLLNIFSTFFLTGLIWTIQIVHYPLFLKIGNNEFLDYHHGHSFRISLIVMPMMLLELISTFLLSIVESNEYKLFHYSGLFLVLIIWLSTFFLSVPEHTILGEGWNEMSIKRLVTTNWIRTIAWSLHSLLLIIELRSKLVL